MQTIHGRSRGRNSICECSARCHTRHSETGQVADVGKVSDTHEPAPPSNSLPRSSQSHSATGTYSVVVRGVLAIRTSTQ